MKTRQKWARSLRTGWKPLLGALGAVALLIVPVVTISTQDAGAEAAGSPVFPSLMRLGAALAAVVALVYLVSIFLKRTGNRKRSQKNNLMNVLEVLPLGTKTKLITVKLGQQVIVIGAGESSVTRITELNEAEYTSFYGREPEGPVVSFKEQLLKLARK